MGQKKCEHQPREKRLQIDTLRQQAATDWIERIQEQSEEAVILDGFNSCIIGIAERYGLESPVLAYDFEKMVDVLVSQGMTRDDAVEYLDFNTVNVWFGPGTPIFISR